MCFLINGVYSFFIRVYHWWYQIENKTIQDQDEEPEQKEISRKVTLFDCVHGTFINHVMIEISRTFENGEEESRCWWCSCAEWDSYDQTTKNKQIQKYINKTFTTMTFV